VNEAMRGVDAVVDLYVGEVKRQAWERAKCAKAGQTEDAKRHEDNEEGLCKRIRSLQTVFRMSNVLKLASAGADRLGITGLEWDLDPWLLPCANGVIDLRSGKLRPGRPEDFVKTVAPVPWTGIHTPAPAWEKFLDAVFDGDDDLIAFVQRLMGYAITGLTSLHLLPILWGIGSNGKTTLVEALAHVLGPLAGQIGSEMILEQRNPRQSGAPTSDVMALRAKRLVCARETNEGRRLDPGRLKLLTGRDTLEGREVFGRHQVSFRPTHQMILITNKKPHAAATDYALWQRLQLIPFTLSFVEEPTADYERQVDEKLPKKLENEASGILAWLVKGCLAWQREGLKPPRAVRAATEDYRNKEDAISRFISEGCVKGPAFSAAVNQLYEACKKWVEENDLSPVTLKRLSRELQERGYERDDTGRTVYFRGIGIREETHAQ
jgi:putative DNA primase/helicase